MSKLPITVLLFLFFAVSATAHAQSTHPEAVEKLMASLYAGARFNGNVMIVDHGKVVLERSYGFANLQERRLLDLDADFQLASLSKQFTAAGILLLQEDGKLRLDQPVSELLPGYPWKTVTVRHLLTHTSGIPAFEENVENGWIKLVSMAIGRSLFCSVPGAIGRKLILGLPGSTRTWDTTCSPVSLNNSLTRATASLWNTAFLLPWA